MFIIASKDLKPKSDSLVVKILSDVVLSIGLMSFDFLLSLPVMFMVFIASAFNDTGSRVESVLECTGFMLLLIVPLGVIQVLFHIFYVRKTITYTVNKCLIGLFSLLLMLYAYGLLSVSYAPDSVFLGVFGKLLGFFVA